MSNMGSGRYEVDIVAQSATVDEAEAQERVTGRPLAKLKGIVSDQEVIQVKLRYKPFYGYDAVLTKRVFAGEDIVYEGLIVVDALSGISRPFLEEQIELTEQTVEETTLLSPNLNESEAHLKARSRRMQVEHREGGEVEMEDEPRMIYKPVWLVELANRDVQVVDATNGRVISDLVLG